MIDTFTDIKELINNAMDNFRRSNLTLIHGGKTSAQSKNQSWRMIQISISGLEVWRRAIISHNCTMEELHKLIQIGMSWNGNLRFRFYYETPDGNKEYLHDKIKLGDINFQGKKELIYEYGSKWNVKVIIMSSYQPANNEVTRFIAGDGAAPPDHVDGPRHFRKLLYSLEIGSNAEKHSAQNELGTDFVPGVFNLDKMNQKLKEIFKNEEALTKNISNDNE
jgi:hypothetical protein